MTFWIPAALLALVAVGFALWPFLRFGRNDAVNEIVEPDVSRQDGETAPAVEALRRATLRTEPDQVLHTLYRQRLDEIEEESALGLHEGSSRAEIERELGRGLLDELGVAGTGSQQFGDPNSPPPSSAPPRGRASAWALPLAVAGIPLFALVLYFQVGEPDAGLLRSAPAALELDPERDRVELDRWRVFLAERLARVPHDTQSLYLLGRLYLMDGDHALAADTFAAAHAVAGDDPVLDLAWLQAVYFASGGWLNDVGRRIAERLLADDPSQPTVLEILAIDAYRRGDYRDAVVHFNRALGNTMAPAQRVVLERFLEQARSMVGDLQPRIDVRISALAVPPASAMLFVIARPVGGGVPFAVVRRAAAPVPEVVRLDDAVSMNPALPLSSAGRIEVVVRVSLTGAAMRHPGDWEWRSEPLSLADAEALIVEAAIGPPDSDSP